MRMSLLVATAITVVLSAAAPTYAGSVDAQTAFDNLKGLSGTWNGEPEGEGAEAEDEAKGAGPVVHEIQVSAAGTVVMETMNPGTEHEMINMYHLDGEDLLLTHYCAGGNQPRMRMNLESSTTDTLVFDFDGGTNLDAAVDQHIHAARISMVDGNHVESIWSAYSEGEEVGKMTFHLVRSR